MAPIEEIIARKAQQDLIFDNSDEPAGIFPEIREILNLRSC